MKKTQKQSTSKKVAPKKPQNVTPEKACIEWLEWYDEQDPYIKINTVMVYLMLNHTNPVIRTAAEKQIKKYVTDVYSREGMKNLLENDMSADDMAAMMAVQPTIATVKAAS